MAGLTTEQIRNQSLTALRQWETIWRKHAENASKYQMKSFADFEGIGAGRACLLVANGWSFEKELETIKKHQGNVDIFACDKTLGHLLENGIKPTYCVVCDANVDYEKYMEKWKDQLQDTILIQNVCANPKWVDNGNWKDRYFFVVKDAIQSEQIFQGLSKCPNTIAAGTNVSNSMVIFMTQCDNEHRRNFFGYDKYLLIGFDYCWTVKGSYYAFDFEGKGKRYYMRHVYGKTLGGDLCYTSNNLAFSVQWLQKYIEAFKLPVLNCSKYSVLAVPGQKKVAKLEEQMQYKGSVDPVKLGYAAKKRRELLDLKRKIEEELNEMRTRQFFDYLASV